MAKKQLATTLELDTIKKLKMLALEYEININDVLEVILDEYSADDIDGKVKNLLNNKKSKLQ